MDRREQSRGGLGVGNDARDIRLQSLARADNVHAHTFSHQTLKIARHIEAQQIEERVHLFGGPTPILRREAENGEVLDAQIARRLDRAKTVVEADHYLISPAFEGAEVDPRTLDWCIRLCKENPPWRLSVQQHKLWKVR